MFSKLLTLMIKSIPIVDLGKICCTDNVSSSDWENVANEIRRNLHEVGFMYLINHGVPQDIVSKKTVVLLIHTILYITLSRLQTTLKSAKNFSNYQEKVR